MKYIISKNGGLEIDLRVIWNEHEKMLRLRVPFASGIVSLIGETAYGAEKLGGGMLENCSQRYIIAEGENSSLLICNDGTYGSAFDDSSNTLYLTLLRSPVYSGHPTGETGNVPEDRYCPHIDIGEHRFRFSFDAGDTTDIRRKAARRAAVLNEAPASLSFYPDGKGVPAKAPITLSGDSAAELTVFKRALDGNGSIARIFNPTDEIRTVDISCHDLSAKLDFAPYEIKTIRITDDDIRETDLIEEK